MNDTEQKNDNQMTDTSRCFRIDEVLVLRLTGPDRHKWFNNFCTANIKDLKEGHGTEAFILNVKGKTLVHAIVIASRYDLTLIVMGKPEESLLDHLNKYIITEDVEIEQLQQHQLWYAAGTKLDSLFEKVGTADSPAYSHGLIRDRTIGIASRISGQLDWLLLVTNNDDVSTWFGGIEMMSQLDFDRLRIQNRWPISGADLTTANLPQEFQRDKQAISFTKGCYLGQETVARIDALGHVNYFFVALQFDGEVDATGAELHRDEKAVGRVTSSVFDPQQGKTLALGFVRRIQVKPDAKFDSEHGVTTIVS